MGLIKMSGKEKLLCEIIPRDTQKSVNSCQLSSFDAIKKKNTWLNDIMQYRVNILWPAKRKAIYLKNRVKSLLGSKMSDSQTLFAGNYNLKPGDIVRVLKEDEIKSTLDGNRKHKGCFFMTEMYQHCDKEYTVLKEVEYFYDEAKKRICRCKDIFLLKNVNCSGKQRLYPVSCDRYCLFFWHKNWLKKIT